MASRGYVVAAIEHRDGTGPSSRITNAEGQQKILDWLDWKDLQYVILLVTIVLSSRFKLTLFAV